MKPRVTEGSKEQSDYLNMTVHIERELWKDFTVAVIKEFGGRCNSLVVKMLMKKYVKGEIKLVA